MSWVDARIQYTLRNCGVLWGFDAKTKLLQPKGIDPIRRAIIGVFIEIDSVAGKTKRIFGNESPKRRTEIPGTVEIESRSVELTTCVGEAVGRGSPGHGRVTE